MFALKELFLSPCKHLESTTKHQLHHEAENTGLIALFSANTDSPSRTGYQTGLPVSENRLECAIYFKPGINKPAAGRKSPTAAGSSASGSTENTHE